ncbi:hypothetical protein DL98DRAFT_580251 [Cadophora sp. DSE1049]|nr:hypothetical protein DL98DRAFT_580251 [Cadophora sp. DSE1049]
MHCTHCAVVYRNRAVPTVRFVVREWRLASGDKITSKVLVLDLPSSNNRAYSSSSCISESSNQVLELPDAAAHIGQSFRRQNPDLKTEQEPENAVAAGPQSGLEKQLLLCLQLAVPLALAASVGPIIASRKGCEICIGWVRFHKSCIICTLLFHTSTAQEARGPRADKSRRADGKKPKSTSFCFVHSESTSSQTDT